MRATTHWPLFALLTCACFLGCGGPAANPGKAGDAKAGDNKGGGDKVTVAFITNNPFEFWTYAERGTEKAAKEFNVNVEFKKPAQGTAPEQRQIVEDLLTKGVKGIAISPNDAENQAEFLNTVGEKIPLITQDSDLPPGSKRVCYIGTNNYEAGKGAGKLLKEALPEGGKFIIYVGKLDVQNAVERRQGVIDEVAGMKDVKGEYPLTLGKYILLDTMTDDAKQAKCQQNVEDSITKYPDLAAMVGLWAYNPPAMLAGVKGAGKVGKIKLIGFDENEETLQGIVDGEIHGTVVQQPFEFGYHAVRLLNALAKGDKSVLPPNGVLAIPHKEIRKDNVEAFWAELKKLRSG
jgi:ribose transport system substrate-binding protein